MYVCMCVYPVHGSKHAVHTPSRVNRDFVQMTWQCSALFSVTYISELPPKSSNEVFLVHAYISESMRAVNMCQKPDVLLVRARVCVCVCVCVPISAEVLHCNSAKARRWLDCAWAQTVGFGQSVQPQWDEKSHFRFRFCVEPVEGSAQWGAATDRQHTLVRPSSVALNASKFWCFECFQVLVLLMLPSSVAFNASKFWCFQCG